jgi:hypothetical protein
VTEISRFRRSGEDSRQRLNLQGLLHPSGVQEWRLEQFQRKGKSQYVSPLDLAELSAIVGRQEEAIRYLQQGLEQVCQTTPSERTS